MSRQIDKNEEENWKLLLLFLSKQIKNFSQIKAFHEVTKLSFFFSQTFKSLWAFF